MVQRSCQAAAALRSIVEILERVNRRAIELVVIDLTHHGGDAVTVTTTRLAADILDDLCFVIFAMITLR
jgi:hypothetical protein